MKRNALSDQSSVSKKKCDITTPPFMHNPIQSYGTPNFNPPSVNETEMNPPRKQSPIDRIKSILKRKKKYSSPVGYGGLPPGVGYGGLPPSGGVGNDHTLLLSHEGDDRMMSGGGGGVVSGHTLLSHEGDDHKMWTRGIDHNDSMMSHPHSHQPNNGSTDLIRDLLEQISILQKTNDEQKEIINRLSSVIEVDDIEHEVPNANATTLKDDIITKRQHEKANNHRLFCYNKYLNSTNTQAGVNDHSSYATVPVIKGKSRQAFFYERSVAHARAIGRSTGLFVASAISIMFMFQKDMELGKEASQGTNRTGVTVHSDTMYTKVSSISKSPLELPIAPYSKTNEKLLKLLDDYIRYLVNKFGCTDNSTLRYHIITYLQGDATGEHADYARKEDLMRGVAMRLLIRMGGCVDIVFSAKKHKPGSKLDSEGEPYNIGFTLRTREGFDMYMMIQNSDGVSLLCHTDESMKYGIQAFHAVKRVGLTNAGSAAIVIDFTVESPLLAKQALDIMRTEPLDLPDNLQKEWEELSSLKDVIIANMNKQNKN